MSILLSFNTKNTRYTHMGMSIEYKTIPQYTHIHSIWGMVSIRHEYY